MVFNLKQNKYIYLALGSNLGDRLKNIKNIISFLSNNNIKILKTSPIYTTPALLLKNLQTHGTFHI